MHCAELLVRTQNNGGEKENGESNTKFCSGVYRFENHNRLVLDYNL
jgi:hypothetical protein